MGVSEGEIRDRISNEDVTVAKSYLEVDVMEWFSDNEIPFGYEAFVIPSVVGPSKDTWDSMVDAIHSVGERDEERYSEISEGTPMEDMCAFHVGGYI
jgi:hypothetical protein